MFGLFLHLASNTPSFAPSECPTLCYPPQQPLPRRKRSPTPLPLEQRLSNRSILPESPLSPPEPALPIPSVCATTHASSVGYIHSVFKRAKDSLLILLVDRLREFQFWLQSRQPPQLIPFERLLSIEIVSSGTHKKQR